VVHNGLTYSFTIQQRISIDESVCGPLYVCLKEPSGHMSTNVKKKLFNTKNIVLTCSKSGKLTSSLITYWRVHFLIPIIKSKTLLLVNSLPHQTNPDLYKNLKNFTYRLISPKTTLIIQSLDVYYNRQHKKNLTSNI